MMVSPAPRHETWAAPRYTPKDSALQNDVDTNRNEVYLLESKRGGDVDEPAGIGCARRETDRKAISAIRKV